MVFPTLYKTTKTNAIQVCKISVHEDTFTVEWGQLEGAMQTKQTTCKPKNVGRLNETTGARQAIKEAQSKWESKVKSGYSESKEAPKTVALSPKVKILQDQEKNVIYPCISTEKLNGVNGTYRLEDDKVVLYSRGGEVFPEIPHITKDTIPWFKALDTNELNGELYIPDTHLQLITGAVKKTKPLSSQLQFRIFDYYNADNPDEDYGARANNMDKVAETCNSANVSLIDGKICRSRDDIEDHYDDCMARNLEGTVIKNTRHLYIHNHRSSDAFKYKKARDGEFLILSMNIDKNGHPVFVCSAGDHAGEFKVKPKGTAEERLLIVRDFSKLYKGKWYTIEYEMLSMAGIPLKPVGIGLRDCSPLGVVEI